MNDRHSDQPERFGRQSPLLGARRNESKTSAGRWSEFSIRALLNRSAERLASNSPTPQLDTEVLLTHLLRKSRSHVHAWPEQILTFEELEAFETLIKKRSNGQPIAYLTGKKEFWSMDFKITPDVLIPRPETELIVALALNFIPQNARCLVADLGTGSGAIAVSLAHERPGIEVHAIDFNQKALDLAKTNAEQHNVQNMTCYMSHWLTDLTENDYQLIVSNPPYIAVNDPHLKQGDVRFEPMTALVAGEDGLDAFRTIAEQAQFRLAPKGRVIFEHGYRQADALRVILKSLGFSNISAHRDYQGHVRATVAQIEARRSSTN